jgi:hypothetical protein
MRVVNLTETLADSYIVIDGYLYVIVEENTRFIKIGYTCDVRRRFKELEKAFPQIFPGVTPKLRLITAIPATSLVEVVIHWFLREEQGYKEWYPPSSKVCMVVELIKQFDEWKCILGVHRLPEELR